jgi:hypothetical protein
MWTFYSRDSQLGCQKRFAREDSLTTHFFKSGWNCFRPLVEGDGLWILFGQQILSGERKDNDFDCNLTSLGCRREFDNLVDLKEHFFYQLTVENV